MKACLAITLIFLYANLFSQETNDLNKNLKKRLYQVDYLIVVENYKKAKFILDSLKQKYTSNKLANKLAIDASYAHLYNTTGEIEKSISILLKGYEITKKEPNSELNFIFVYTLAQVYFYNDLPEKFFDYSQKSLNNALYRKDEEDIFKSKAIVGRAFDLLARHYYHDKSLKNMYQDSSRYYYNSALKHKISKSNNHLLITIYNNLSNSYTKEPKKNLHLSLIMANKKIELVDKKDFKEYSSSFNLLGNIYYINKEYDLALKKYLEGYEYLKQCKNKNKRYYTYQNNLTQNIAWSFEELRMFEESRRYQNLAEGYKDSIDLFQTNIEFTNMETKYKESFKREKEKNIKLKNQILFSSLSFTILLVLFLWYNTYKKNKSKQFDNENKITALKYKALNAQMNPHFINNLLTNINNTINNNDNELASKNLEKFNRLTNLVLKSTKHNLITLSNEIKIIELYLDLQKTRYSNSFDYRINYNTINNKNQIMIPPMILQPIVENSIIHGISNHTLKGKIEVNLIIKNDFLICIVTDNGNKENKSKISLSSGISLNNINDRLRLINNTLNKNDSFIEHSNIINEKKHKIGYKTILKIPLLLNS